MSTKRHIALSHTSEMTDFSFIAFLRELDRRNAREAANELNRRLVRRLTQDSLASAH